MKKTIFRASSMMLFTVLCLTANAAGTDKASSVSALKKELSAVAVPEMPAKAAQLVAQAKADALEATAEAVVTAAVNVRPAATVAVVSAIARENPAAAAVAAARAATLRPKDAAWIARAAAGAAPAQAGKIVFALCKALPGQYAVIATAVAQVVPDAAKEILQQVVAAVPALKPFVDRVSADSKDASMGQIMAQTESLVQAAAKAAKTTPEKVVGGETVAPVPANALPPPSVGPPFTPITGTPTETGRTNTVEIPPGGARDYSGG